MALISSISGIRGTIGSGNNNLNVKNFIDFTLSFGQLLKDKKKDKSIKAKIVVGRDGRLSGETFLNLAINSLVLIGIDVINIDLASTPTVEMAVSKEEADGGIIISASHNEENWNALKLLNNEGEFVSKEDSYLMSEILKKNSIVFVDKVDNIGKIKNENYNDFHIQEILKLRLVKKDLIKKKNFKVVVDCINSVGALAVPILLEKLGVSDYILINSDISKSFSHNPEPINKNLEELSAEVLKSKADLGVAFDPDVDRISFVDQKGDFLGEEYSLISICDYALRNFSLFQEKYKKSIVTNLSSSMALNDLALNHGAECFFSEVGELNVVSKMKKEKAFIGGEGNGGIILPELHFGRDALLGLALFLSYLSDINIKCSEVKSSLPKYFLVKNKVSLDESLDFNKIFARIEEVYREEDVLKVDGLKIIFKDKSWFHLRQSNTEPIIRIYCEAKSLKEAEGLFNNVSSLIKSL